MKSVELLYDAAKALCDALAKNEKNLPYPPEIVTKWQNLADVLVHYDTEKSVMTTDEWL